MTFCQRCKELEARISALEAQLLKKSENSEDDSYYKKVIELLKDTNLKPSDLSQINLPLLTNSSSASLFATELLGLTPLNRVIGFVIFLKHKNPEYAIQVSNEMYKRTSEKTIRDSLDKLFPHQMPSAPTELKELKDVKEKNETKELKESKEAKEAKAIKVTNEVLATKTEMETTTKNQMKDEINNMREDNAEYNIETMKKLLKVLLEQAYSDDIDPRLYQQIRECAITVGPTETYELFVRKELWPQFPSNLDSNFSRVAFLALYRLLQELLETFPPEIQTILQQKLSMIQISTE